MENMLDDIDSKIIRFDSDGEEFFYYYLEELKDNGFVKDFSFHPDPFKLSDKVEYQYVKKLKTKEVIQQTTLLNAHEYTPDFKIIWDDKSKGIFFDYIDQKKKVESPFIANSPNLSVCEIKSSWDHQNMTRLFVINSKWVYQKYGIYLQKITPFDNKKSCLFKDTFVPEKCLYTKKTKKKKQINFTVRTLEQFIKENSK